MKYIKLLGILSTLILLSLNSVFAQDVAKEDVTEMKVNISEITKENNTFTGVPEGFRTSPNPHSVMFSPSIKVNSNRMNFSVNSFASIEEIILDRNELFLTNEKEFSLVKVKVKAVDPENDPLNYNYTVSAGKIIGQGENVIWDLFGAEAGTYSITVMVDDGCGDCAEPKTETVRVLEKKEDSSDKDATEKQDFYDCQIAPSVIALELSQAEIILNCQVTDKNCSSNKIIDVRTVTIDMENIKYMYIVSAGKIIGEGANVEWDLSNVKPGKYTITSAIAQPSTFGKDGWDVFGTTMTKTITVIETIAP